MDNTFFPSWREESGDSKYPLADSATMRSLSGLTLSSQWLQDASLYPVGGEGGARLGRISVSPEWIEVFLSDDGAAERASGGYDPRQSVDSIPLFDSVGRAAGILVFSPEESSALAAWPSGDHRFSAAAAPFAAGVCHPVPSVGVSGFQLDSGEVFSGAVYLVGEDGVVLREESGGVRVDVVGDPLFRRKLCGDSTAFETPRMITSINNVPLGPDGQFQLSTGDRQAAGSILRIYPVDGKLRIEAVGQSTGQTIGGTG